jgi:four helix bundle protein
MPSERKVQTHRDLLVWQKACELIKQGLKILRGTRKDFVSWVIIQQAVRSLLSARANIVEGWCSHQGKSFASYLEVARGSAGETEDWFYALWDEGYISEKDYQAVSRLCGELMAMLTSFIRNIRQGKSGRPEV